MRRVCLVAIDPQSDIASNNIANGFDVRHVPLGAYLQPDAGVPLTDDLRGVCGHLLLCSHADQSNKGESLSGEAP